MIDFDSEECTNYKSATSREWLETNKIGGFACSTISGVHTRRYHALLTSATAPPLGRISMLSKYEETITIDGARFELSANRYPGAIFPEGYKHIKNFRLAPFPVWTYEVGGVEIVKKTFMVSGENTVVCSWTVFGTKNKKIELELKPLLAFRGYHHLQHENTDFNGKFNASENKISIKPYAKMPPLFFIHNAKKIEKQGVWYRNFEYEIEEERGFDFREDLFQPFSLKFDLHDSAFVIASLSDSAENANVKNLEKREVERREELIKQAGAKSEFVENLVLAADQFIVSRGKGKTIIAGYPWFSDWGRDTMIALNGLTLATNRADAARSILLEYSKHISEGMIPNRFPDAGDEAEYNTVDATLWYFEAIRAYAEATNDFSFVRKSLYEKLVNIVLWHLLGTRYNIRVDDDNLLYAGDETVQLTWMDAKIGDYVVTPRTGKAVEIQALWYNALCTMADFAKRFDDEADQAKYIEMANKTKASFNKKFWNASKECLYDVINGAEKDDSVRPNQIFAVSLPHSMLSLEKSKKIIEKVEAELLTPVGLRSLSPANEAYRPIYTGSPFERDTAYHQGTVWAWLIGAYIDAYRKVYSSGKEQEEHVNAILENFARRLREAGVGQISEIFDADAPHTPRGCFAQAWSVAEVLRVAKKTNF